MAASVVRAGAPVNHPPRSVPGFAQPGDQSVSLRGMTAGPVTVRVEIDGVAATVEALSAVAPAGYGHFTAMQVQEHRVRGLDLHLARLDAANREIFGVALDPATVRAHIRHALGGGTGDASVRVHVCEMPGGPSVVARR
jgi:hypothetical protein